jgi:hypothetical protein
MQFQARRHWRAFFYGRSLGSGGAQIMTILRLGLRPPTLRVCWAR